MVPACSGNPKGRVFVKDLAYYLGHPIRSVYVWAREHGLLREAPRGPGQSRLYFVSEEAAMRIIAVFRVIQGKAYQEGEDFHGNLEKQRLYSRAQAAKQRAAAEVEKAGMLARSQICLANPPAHPEADSAERSGGKEESEIAGNPGGVML